MHENEIKIIRLNSNGNLFNSENYNKNDNLDAFLLYRDNLVNIRVVSILNGLQDDISIDIMSDKNQLDGDFKKWLDNFEEDYDVRQYIVNGFQEYLYPFIYDGEVNDFILMVRWVYKNMKEDEQLSLYIHSFSKIENRVIIKRNDIGVSVDYYDDIHDEPINTRQVYFNDYFLEDIDEMDKKLLEALSHQLKKEGSCAFKYSGKYYNIYENEEEGGYYYDKYESMQDSEPLVSISCECDDEDDAILFAIM